MKTNACVLALAVLLLGGCRAPAPAAMQAAAPMVAGESGDAPVFVPYGDAGPLPWSRAGFLNDPDEFQFAIIADVHGGNRPGIFEDAVGKLNLMRPEFVLSVGDLIAGYTDDRGAAEAQWAAFRQQVAPLGMRFFFVPGNHDLSNQMMTDLWEELYGRSYYHFVYRDVLFLCLNSEDPPDTQMSDEQAAYVSQVLADHPDVRWTFVFMHKPLWTYGPTGWQKIEAMLADRPHTVLAGHHHNYVKYERHGQSYSRLATTGGASALGGPEVGEFDHITWVTVTDDGPVMANVALDGILDEDVVTEEVRRVLDAVQGGGWVEPGGLVSQETQFTRGELQLDFSNPTPGPLEVRWSLRDHAQLTTAPSSGELRLEPGAEETLIVRVTTEAPVALAELAPPVLDASATCALPGRPPIKAQRAVELDVRGAWQGPELVGNGRFSSGDDRWAIWALAHPDNSAQVVDGELVVHIVKTDNWWEGGAWHAVGPLRAGVRYRLSLRAANSGPQGELHLQIKDGEAARAVVVNGGRVDDFALPLTEEPKTYSFEVGLEANAANGRLLLFFGGLKDARIDDVSLREITGEAP